jgi:CBS domain-containing protein
MKVFEIMSIVLSTVDAEAPVMEAARLLVENHLPGVPVVDRSGHLVGVVTEEDLIVRNARLHLPRYLTFLDGLVPAGGQREFDDEMRHMLATHAKDVMSAELHTISPDADVADAATLMMDEHINPLPVVSAGKLVGLISRADIVRLMVHEEEEPPATTATAR